MAQYKVPQDVEADDKLLGPFTFRQFVYLMIIGGLVAIGFLLWQIFPLLIIILIPPILLLGALALPFKKDQPMETYLSAIVSYHLKPHTRVWEAGEPEATIVITAPKKTDEVHLKGISQEEATHRLSFLADIVDTEGYAIKGGIKEDVYAEANNTKDIFEMAQSSTLNQALQSNATSRHDELVNQMRQAIERNNSLTSSSATIGHHFNNPQVQPLNQPSPYTSTPSFNPTPTVTPMPMPTPTPMPTPIATPTTPTPQPSLDQPLSAYGPSNLGTDPYQNSSAVIQPDLPLPETAVPSSYNEQIAETSEYLPEDEKERLEGNDSHEDHPHDEQSQDEQPQENEEPQDEQIDYYEENSDDNQNDDSDSKSDDQNSEPESHDEEPAPEPESEPEPEPEPEPSQQMIDLANNPDFSIETIAQQANRINNEENNNKDEVYVSLH